MTGRCRYTGLSLVRWRRRAGRGAEATSEQSGSCMAEEGGTCESLLRPRL